MSELHLEVGVIVARRAPRSPWASAVWIPSSVLSAPPPLAFGVCISKSTDEELYYAGAAALALYASEASHYRDNLASDRTSLWVALSDADEVANVVMVTVDPYEGEALAEVYGEKIDAVPMPQTVFEYVAHFVTKYYVERKFAKRSRS